MVKSQVSLEVQDGTGWFCKRPGIHNLPFKGDKLSADTEASATFFTTFNEPVERAPAYSQSNQISNRDETGPFQLLPDRQQEDLISDDGNITALYLSRNITSLVQPIDQRVLFKNQ